jgi:hypothetical protein
MMSSCRTAEETKQYYVKAMGAPLGELFHALWQEVVALHFKWAEYVELFGTNSSRIELLNKAAPQFFRIVQDSLLEDVILHIARLTDPPESVHKANLTILRLPSLVDDANTAKSISCLIDAAVQASEFCRDWRNRRIAHRDLKLAIKADIPLKPASRKKVREALSSIAEVLNVVTQHYTRSTTAFDIGGDSGGAVSLLYVIEDGLKTQAERRERIRQGRYREGDFGARSL